MKTSVKGALLLLLTGVLWGTAGMYVNLLSSYGAGTYLIILFRLIPTFFVLMILTLVVYGAGALKVPRKTILFSALIGIISQGLFNLCNVSAVMQVGMSFASVLLYLAPTMTAIISAFVFHEKMTGMKVFALLVNIFGCALTVTGGRLAGLNLPVSGVVMGILSALCFSLSAVFGRVATRDDNVPPIVVSTWTFFFAALFGLVFFLPRADFSSVHTTAGFWLLGLCYCLFTTVLSYITYYGGIRRTPETGRIQVFTSVEPVVATIIGTAVFGDPVGTVNWIGVLLVICSILLMNAPRKSGHKRRS